MSELAESLNEDSIEPHTGAPPPPSRPMLDIEDPKTQLRRRVESALLALPGEFAFDNPISGINATDLFNINTLMGAAIEIEVVRTLNGLRGLWDPDGEWLGYTFERSSQAFPDVRLVRRSVGEADASDRAASSSAKLEIALGIELKGWFLLAKEGVPSMRYQIAPDACAPHDLVCVVPWYLTNAVAGTPRVTTPWVESARYAAEYRDFWWQHVRDVKNAEHDREISYPEPQAHPYPAKAELAAAVPLHDGGNNFGRLPRCKPLMTDFIEKTVSFEILGISTRDWFSFLRLHTDTVQASETSERLALRLGKHIRSRSDDAADRVIVAIDSLKEIFKN